MDGYKLHELVEMLSEKSQAATSYRSAQDRAETARYEPQNRAIAELLDRITPNQ